MKKKVSRSFPHLQGTLVAFALGGLLGCNIFTVNERTNPFDPDSTLDFDEDGVPNNEDCDADDPAVGRELCGDRRLGMHLRRWVGGR